MFMDAKTGISDISKDLLTLCGKLRRIEDIFKNVDLSKFAEASPKRKKSTSRLEIEVNR